MKIMEEACSHHPQGRIIGKCSNCGKPICTECVKYFGYFCSMRCQIQTKEKTRPAASPEEKKKVEKIEKRAQTSSIILFRILPFVLVIGLALFIYLKITSGIGKIRWKTTTEIPVQGVFAANNNLLAISPGKIILYDSKKGNELWSLIIENIYFIGFSYHEFSNSLFLATSDYLKTIDCNNGNLISELKLKNKLQRHPLFSGNHVYLCDVKNSFPNDKEKSKVRLYSYSLPDLKKEWSKIVKKTPQFLIGAYNIVLLGSVYPPEYMFIKCEAHKNAPDSWNLFSCTNCQYVKEKEDSVIIIARNQTTGEKLWKIEYESSVRPDIIPYESDFIIFTGRTVNRINQAGKFVWKVSLSDELQRPFIYGIFKRKKILSKKEEELFYYQDNEDIIFLDIKTGEETYRLKLDSNIESLIVNNDTIYYIYGKPVEDTGGMHPAIAQITPKRTLSSLRAVSISTGKPLWTTEKVRGNLIMKGKFLYSFSSRMSIDLLDNEKFMADKTRIRCFNPRTGGEYWHFTGDGGLASFVFADKTLFLVLVEVFISTPIMFSGPDKPPAYHLMGINIKQ